MESTIEKFEQLINQGSKTFKARSEQELTNKAIPNKWSKKEIMGHLIDSAINNLKRFTEVQFATQPYQVNGYQQDELVKVNGYQEMNSDALLQLWESLNQQLIRIIRLQTEESLGLELKLSHGDIISFRALIIDYVIHLEHHLKQL